MARVDEIHNASFDYLEANHSPPNVSECQAAMNIAVVKAYIAAAKWADETMIEKACEFMKKHHQDYSFWDSEEYELVFETDKFIEDFRARFRAQLDNIELVEPDDPRLAEQKKRNQNH